MERKTDALEVIEATHIIDDKSVDVKPAVPKTFSGTAPCEVRKIYVGNVPLDATVQELADPFRAYGTVKEARIILDRDTGNSRGFGFVTYEDPACVEKLMVEHPAVHVKGNQAEYRRAQPKIQETTSMTYDNRHSSKPSRVQVQKGAGGNWDGGQSYYAPYNPHGQGASQVYAINSNARGMHANTAEVVPVMYSYTPYSADSSQYAAQMVAQQGAMGYQHSGTIVTTDPHSPPVEAMTPPPVAMPGAAGDYMMAPHANPAYHGSAQAYQTAYQPYAMMPVPQYQHQHQLSHHQHQHQGYSGAAIAHMEQFPMRQTREMHGQRSRGPDGPSHVILHSGHGMQMQVQAQQAQGQGQGKGQKQQEFNAVAASDGGDNRYPASDGDRNEVE
jgi:hypothetical protein